MFQVRKELGIANDVKVVIFNFGGQVRELPTTHLCSIDLPISGLVQVDLNQLVITDNVRGISLLYDQILHVLMMHKHHYILFLYTNNRVNFIYKRQLILYMPQ